jgi:hypothetical protein
MEYSRTRHLNFSSIGMALAARFENCGRNFWLDVHLGSQNRSIGFHKCIYASGRAGGPVARSAPAGGGSNPVPHHAHVVASNEGG